MSGNLPAMNSLRAFEAAGRLGSFNLAADELALSPSTVSYRIQKLERELGIRLFERMTRKVSLTDDGHTFLQAVTQCLAELRAGVERISGEALNPLVVTLSTYLATRWLSPRLSKWTSSRRGGPVHLHHDFRDGARGSDVVIVWSRDAVFNHSANLLFPTDMSVYCSPEIVKVMREPDDVLKHPLLAAEPHMDPWPDWMEAAGLEWPDRAKIVRMPDSNVRIRAAADGHGVVLANHLIGAEIAAGQLIRPFDVAVRGPGFHVREQSTTPERSQDFVRWLRVEASAYNAQIS